MRADASISLIICSKNRAAKLAQCLSAVRRLAGTCPRFEFILVDNGSDDETRLVFDRCLAAAPFVATYVFEAQPGVGHALNSGYRHSRGDVIAFTDDDCYPAPDFLAAVAASFADPTVGVATGRVLLHNADDLPLTIVASAEVRRIAPGSYVWPGLFLGANLSFRRAALESIGGFDPLFGPGSYIGSAADCDAAARVCLAGWAGVYNPAIVVRHHHGRSHAERRDVMRRYALGSGGYHMKLLLRERQLGHWLRYLRAMPRRACRWPGTIYWEAIGAMRYARRALTQPDVPMARVIPPSQPGARWRSLSS